MKIMRVLAVAALLCATRPLEARVTDEQVQAKIKQIVEKLYGAQNERGTWDPESPPMGSTGAAEGGHVFGINYGGTTALATYALLTAGESYQSPKLKRAVEFLASPQTQMGGVYAVGLRNHVWGHLPPSFEPQMKQDTKWLLEAIGGGPAKGGYHYTPAQSKAGAYDNSVTQYGVLGAWEGAKRGMPINQAYWDLVGKHFVATQKPDGGWDYNGKQGSYGSMAASGLACLFIVQDYLHSQDFRKTGEFRKHPLQGKIDKGLKWFDEHFDASSNPGQAAGINPYYLVGVERVGLASGYKYFAGKDWYAEGAGVLVNAPYNDPHGLSFSLIFLVRGRVPVFANKLRVPDYDWNNRPRDLNRLAEWVSDEVEQEMNWQIVDADGKPEEWLDAPILYIAGHQPLKLSPTQEQKIKRYIDLGGMVITTADEGEQAFSKSVTEMYERLYPEYKLQRLNPKDDLMGMVFKLRGDKLGVMSLHNGVRHLALHIQRDVSWTLHAANHSDDHAWQFFANTYYYATEKGQARPRLALHYVGRGAGGGPKIGVARVRHDGNWNPVPLAWEVQANAMFNAKKADVTVKEVEAKDLAASGVRFAHLVGTGEVKLSEEQAEGLKAFVEGGGLVLIENAGGREAAFSQSVVAMLSGAFPGQQVRPLGLQSDIVTGKGYNGHDVSKAEYRAYTLLRSGKFKGPRLQAMTLDGRPAVIISNEDLSMAMLNQPVWGVYGYNAAAAQQIMTNLVLASQLKSASPPAPAAQAPAAIPAEQ